jgi:hypothetical protein
LKTSNNHDRREYILEKKSKDGIKEYFVIFNLTKNLPKVYLANVGDCHLAKMVHILCGMMQRQQNLRLIWLQVDVHYLEAAI